MTPAVDRRQSQSDLECPVAGQCTQVEEIADLKMGMLEITGRIGSPPDPSRGAIGTGIAGTVSQIAVDVASLKSRSNWPTTTLRTLGMVLAVAVPIALGIQWLLAHMRFTP